MKTLLNKFLLLTLASMVLWGCKKDETLTKVGIGVEPFLTSSATSLVLTEATKANTALTLSWSPADFQYSAAVTYTVQIAKKGTNFANPRNKSVDPSKLSLVYTVEQLNSMLLLAGYDYGVSSQVEIRVKTTINNAIAPIYSNVKTLTVTPYEVVIVYPTWYVPGAHQGWDPSTAPAILSLNNNNIFEGYVNFPSATNEFKVTPGKSWTGDRGGDNTGVDANGVNSGTVSGGNNMKVFGAGYYLLQVNFTTNTYKAYPMNWGVIGDATPTGWGSDTDLVYDPADGKLKVTLALTVGNIKFRANDKWDDNYGDKTGDLVLDKINDNNIPITVAGTYRIELDMRNYAKLVYKLTKL